MGIALLLKVIRMLTRENNLFDIFFSYEMDCFIKMPEKRKIRYETFK